MQHKHTTKPLSDVQVNEDLKEEEEVGFFPSFMGKIAFGMERMGQTCTGKGFSCGDIS